MVMMQSFLYSYKVQRLNTKILTRGGIAQQTALIYNGQVITLKDHNLILCLNYKNKQSTI